jgi:type II secretory pathway component PulF
MRKLSTGENLLAGIAFAGISVIFAILFRHVPKFAEMFKDFGGPLPWSTRILLARWPMMVYAGVCGLLLMAGLSVKKSWLIVAFAGALVGVAFCFLALYAPIFELAGKIRAE